MSWRFVTRTWVGALMALFLVAVLPACWFGAMSRAALAGSVAPSSSNNNEEREEHHDTDDHRVAGIGRPPPKHKAASRRAPVTTSWVVMHATPTIIESVAPQSHPSQFSVRRLI